MSRHRLPRDLLPRHHRSAPTLQQPQPFSLSGPTPIIRRRRRPSIIPHGIRLPSPRSWCAIVVTNRDIRRSRRHHLICGHQRLFLRHLPALVRELLLRRFPIRLRREPVLVCGSLPGGGRAWSDGGELPRSAAVAAVEELARAWAWDGPCRAGPAVLDAVIQTCTTTVPG